MKNGFVITGNGVSFLAVLDPMYMELNVQTLFVPQDKNSGMTVAHRGDNLYRLSPEYCAWVIRSIWVFPYDVHTTIDRKAILAVASGLTPRATTGCGCIKIATSDTDNGKTLFLTLLSYLFDFQNILSLQFFFQYFKLSL